jgi:hypothetical protein
MIEELLRILALIICIIAPAWAFVKSEDGEEM